MTQHRLDPYPIPKDKSPLYVNEPWLIDNFLYGWGPREREPEKEEDNVRVYIPLDLNKSSILRRLKYLIAHYEEANEENESDFSQDVDMLIEQIEIYDRIWYIRHMPENQEHSYEGIELVKEFVKLLEDIPDGCAELFPFDTIDALRSEYLSE